MKNIVSTTKPFILMMACLFSLNTEAKVSSVPHYIAIDISGSSPIMKDTNFLNRALPKLNSILRQAVRPRNLLELSTIGEDNIDAIFIKSWRAGRKPSRDIAAIVNYAGSLHKTPSRQQGKTRLWSYFANTSFNCEAGSVITLITDGLLTGEEGISINNVINNKSKIPPLPGKLDNCKVVFIGIGVSKDALSSRQKQNLRSSWKQFVELSGGKYRQEVTR